eukprot:4289712-Prymnesium_polylepis.2
MRNALRRWRVGSSGACSAVRPDISGRAARAIRFCTTLRRGQDHIHSRVSTCVSIVYKRRTRVLSYQVTPWKTTTSPFRATSARPSWAGASLTRGWRLARLEPGRRPRELRAFRRLTERDPPSRVGSSHLESA